MMEELSRPLVLNREGKSLSFKRLTPSQIVGEFRSSFLLYRKGKLIESLALLGINGTAAIPYCDQFDAKAHRLRDADVKLWVNDPPGRKRAIILSLQRDDPKAGDAEFDALDLSPAEQIEVAAGVMRMSLGTGEGDKQNPTGGAAEPTRSSSSPSAPTPSSGFTVASPTPEASPSTSTTAV